MFTVQQVDYEASGLEFRRVLYRSKNVNDCWKFLDGYRLAKGDDEISLFVFDKLGDMCFNVELQRYMENLRRSA